MKFPSAAWCERLLELARGDPESAAAATGWKGDVGALVEAEPGKLAQPFAVHFTPDPKRFARFEVLEDADELDEMEPAYLAQAPYSVWKGLIQGRLDPVEAVLTKKVKMRGDLQQIIERMRYKGLMDRVLAQLPSEFPDEEGR